MYNWSTDEKKFKKEVEGVMASLLKTKWVKDGKVYVCRRQNKLFRQSPIMVLIRLDDVPKCNYVGLSFNFDDEISRNVSIIDKPKDVGNPRNYRLIRSF